MKTTEAVEKIKTSKLEVGSESFFHNMRILHAEEGYRVLSTLCRNDEEKITLSLAKTAEKQSMNWVEALASHFGIPMDKKIFTWNYRRMVARKYPKAQEKIMQELTDYKLRRGIRK